MPLIAIMLLAALLSGCAGMSGSSDSQRPPLERLGARAARAVIEGAGSEQPMTLQMAPLEADAAFGADAARRLDNALTRALLALPNGPQLIPAFVGPDDLAQLPADQWLLTSTLRAPSQALQLTDRQLQPYRLLLSLYRGGSATPFWQRTLEGVLEHRDLPPSNADTSP